MTNKEKYKEAFSAVSVSDELSAKLKAAVQTQPPRRKVRWPVAALAAVLALSLALGAYAVGKAKDIRTKSITDQHFSTVEETNAALRRGIGVLPRDIVLPDKLGNGFQFWKAETSNATDVDGDGQPISRHTDLTVSYCRGESVVNYAMMPEPEWGEYHQRETVEIGGVTVSKVEYTAKCVSPDYVATPEELEAEAAGRLILDRYSGLEPRERDNRGLGWVVDGIVYTLYDFSHDVTMDELLAMAEALIGK